MILTTFSDHFPVSISFRIRLVFFFYALISLAVASLAIFRPNEFTDFDYLYMVLFPVSAICCLSMVFKPAIGSGSIYLLPLFIASCIRVVDFWINFMEDDISLEVATRGSIGWSFLLVSIAYIDLLESRIYHRMVNYIEQEAE